MTPDEYERHVAAVLAAEGWKTTVVGRVGDHGIDVIAERDGRRVGVQAKTWDGANRKINGRLVMTVYGAAAFHDCPEALIATDAAVLPDARQVAAKLGVEIRHLPARSLRTGGLAAAEPPGLTFGYVWTEHVAPLAGRTLTRENGSSNEIVAVDGGGITRRTSNGRIQHIEIEIFRWAIERLLHGATVTREEINEQYEGRASSGIMLVLSSLPVFEPLKLHGRQAVRLSQSPRRTPDRRRGPV